MSQNVLRTLPETPEDRKASPITTGVLDYFPLAVAEVARLSKVANDQHNPGEPLHWAREKSTDHADCIVRHLIERGTIDTDGQRHTAKVAWRALALLQEEIEAEAGFVPAPNDLIIEHNIILDVAEDPAHNTYGQCSGPLPGRDVTVIQENGKTKFIHTDGTILETHDSPKSILAKLFTKKVA